jgi:hypothetical protein
MKFGECLLPCSSEYFVSYLFHLFIYNFNYTAWNDSMLVNNELARMWKEAVVAQFKVLACRS